MLTLCFGLIWLITEVVARPHSTHATHSNHHHWGGHHHDHNDPLVVNTRSGKIRGVARLVQGKEIHVFQGIPFAKPPLGAHRFRKPVPYGPWEGVLNATERPNSCFQERYEYFPGFEGEAMWNPNTKVSEDCLYLSIWVPQRVRIRHTTTNEDQSNKHKVPVLIWIYGGGFMSGTATLDIYEADIVVATNDVIVAAMQYRVGAFGFLYLAPVLPEDSEDAPGNMGLYDQTLAIRWIKDHIEAFGGDPDLITLFGESAGGSSVSLHLISPLTRGLVKRGIMQSGTVNAPWSFMTADRSLDVAKRLIHDCKCNVSMLNLTPSKVMACMRSVAPEIISKEQWNSYSGILGFPSAPTIDGIFLPKHPLDMLQSGDFQQETEIIIGSNLDEGTYFLLYDFMDFFDKRNPSSLARDKFLEITNTIFYNFSHLERDALVFQYTDWENVNDLFLNQKMIADVVGDYFFTCPTNQFAQLFAEHNEHVYYYYFTQRTSTSLWGDWMGVMHGDEIQYVFGHPLNNSLNYNARERDLGLRIMNTFANFALTGKPTTSEDDVWPPYSREEPYYYVLDAEKSGLSKGPRSTACAFWINFFPKLKEHSDGNYRCPWFFESSKNPEIANETIELATIAATPSPSTSGTGLGRGLVSLQLNLWVCLSWLLICISSITVSF